MALDAFGNLIFPGAPRPDSLDAVAEAAALGSTIPTSAGRIADGATAAISLAGGAHYILPALSQNIVITIGTGGTPITGECIIVDVTRTSAFTVTFNDDAAAALFVVPASAKKTVMAAYDGTHFANARALRIQ